MPASDFNIGGVEGQIAALNSQLGDIIKCVEVLTFNSTDLTQTATKSELIGYAIIGFAVSQQKYGKCVDHYITDLNYDSSTGGISVTRTGAGVYATSKLWVYAVKIPS